MMLDGSRVVIRGVVRVRGEGRRWGLLILLLMLLSVRIGLDLDCVQYLQHHCGFVVQFVVGRCGIGLPEMTGRRVESASFDALQPAQQLQQHPSAT